MAIRSKTGKKVFITNLGYHDYSPAKRFGDLVPCTRGHLDLRQTDRIEARVQDVLEKAENGDFLLLSGPPLIVGLCLGYWFRCHRTVNILYWDPLVGDYLLRPTDFAPREAQIEALLDDEESPF